MTQRPPIPTTQNNPFGAEPEETRQPLDIAKEFFTETEKYTKSDVSSQEIVIMTRALVYGNKYRISLIRNIVETMLLLKRSKGGKVLKFFRDTVKGMQPKFEQSDMGEHIMQ